MNPGLKHITSALITLLFCINQTKAQQRSYGIISSDALYRGGYIREVVPGGPAEKMGIKSGDMITHLAGKKSDSTFFDTVLETFARYPDTITIKVKREGKPMTFKLRSMDALSFGRKCLSGDCQNGTGELKIGGMGNKVYKGKFKVGILSGESEIIHDTGKPYYIGTITNFKRNGNGETYSRYGELESRGSYTNDKLTSGVQRLSWDYYSAFLHAEKIRYGKSNTLLLEGEVKYTKGSPSGQLLATAKFDHPQTTGCDSATIITYDYDKDVRIVARMEGNRTTGSLFDSKTGRLKGKDLVLAPCEVTNLDSKILSGTFNLSEIDVKKLWVDLNVKNYNDRSHLNIYSTYMFYTEIIVKIADSITKADAARVAANPGAYSNGSGQANTKSYSKYDNCSESQKSTAKESYSKAVASFNRDMTIVNGYIKDYNKISSDNKGAENFGKKLVFEKAVVVYRRAKAGIDNMIKYYGDCLPSELYYRAQDAVDDMYSAIYDSY